MLKSLNTTSAIGGLAGVLVLIGIANFLSVKWLNYPFAYCWGREGLRFTGLATAYEFLAIGLAMFALALGIVRGVKAAILPLVVMTVVLVVPGWAEILFRHGAYCDAYEEVEAQEMQRQEQLRRQGQPLPIPRQPNGAPGLY